MDHSFQLCSNILDNLQWLRKHSELCDIILLTQGQKLFAHSCILASQSPVLAAILQARLASEKDWSVLKPLIISLDEGKLSVGNKITTSASKENILEILISFMYGEAISIEDSRLNELISFSKTLGLSQHFQDPLLNTFTIPVNNLFKKHKRRRKPDLQQENYSACTTIEKEKVSTDISIINNERLLSQPPKEDKREIHNVDNNIPLLCRIPKDVESNLSIKSYETTKKNNNSLPQEQNNGSKSFMISDTETETWFRNELLNPIEIKILAERNNFDAENGTNLDKVDECRIDKSLSKIFVQDNVIEHTRKSSRLAISCQICSSSFHRANDLVQHVKTENHYSQVCPLCFLQVNDFNEQEVHFLQHDHQLPFFCFCCDLRFRSRAGLSMHAPKHSSTKPYLCKECGRGFKWRHAAQAHAITHRSHRHLLCDICGFSSKYMSTFQSHLKRHHDQFFPCPHPGCKFKSYRKTHLTDHIATHAKLRPHQCEVCGHSFSQAKNLRRHMRLHAPDSSLLRCAPLSKEECSFGTTRPDKLRAHLVKKHNIIPCGRNSLDSCAIFKEGGQSPKGTNPERTIETNENVEAVSVLKTVLFEENNADKELFINSILSNKPILCSSSTTSKENLFVKSSSSEGSDVSKNNACESSIIDSSSYEAFFIPERKYSKADREVEVKIEPLVLMEGIEINCFSSNNDINIQESDSLQQGSSCSLEMINNMPVVFSNDKAIAFLHNENSTSNLNDIPNDHVIFNDTTNIDDFTITPSSSLENEDNQSLQIIRYLPQLGEESLSSNQPSSINVILEENSQIESEFQNMQSSQYIELPVSLNSIMETDEPSPSAINVCRENHSLTAISSECCEYAVPVTLDQDKLTGNNIDASMPVVPVPVSTYSISTDTGFDSLS